jgi:Tfp pilus assembly protein PilV
MLTGLRRRIRAEHGLSVTEVLIALGLALVIGTAALSALSQGTRAAQRSHNRITALAELQTTAQRIARELRAADPITVAEASEVEATIQRQGQIRTYRYRLVGSGSDRRIEEVRTVAGVTSTTVLARGFAAGGMTVRYFDGAGTELSPPVTGGSLPLISTVRVTLTRFIPLNTAPITLETTVDVRNQA